MIWTVMRIGLLRLKNTPMELVLMFVVPIIFFSIFALIFGKGIGSGKTAAVKVVFVDEDDTPTSRRIIDRLNQESGLDNKGADLTLRDDATEMIRNSEAKLAIVIPTGFGAQLADQKSPKIGVLADTSDQIASQLVSAMIRQVVWTEKAAVEQLAAKAAAAAAQKLAGGPGGRPGDSSEVRAKPVDGEIDESVGVDTTDDVVVVKDVLAAQKVNPRVSMYAAGIAVMFLLFSASGAGGTLLEEQEAGTLERLLSSQLSINQLLIGKWLFITIIGSLQLTVMFMWAQIVFGVDLAGHLPGFIAMTIPTAAAAASLALLLATLCKTRAQLNGISVILILTMSALGGSMVPRYIMSEQMQKYGLITFNAWALDGFNKVFWRDLPVSALSDQITVLVMATAAMFVLARVFARRWET